MTKFIIRRLLYVIPVVFMTLLVTFTLVRLMPGGPFDAGRIKSPSKEVEAALEARYGLDKPLFLNLPNDGAGPDAGKEYRQEYAKFPNCDKLAQGMTREQATDPDAVEVSSGWYLLHTVNEHITSTIRMKDGDSERNVLCDRVRTVLYSDLTRSQFFEYVNNALRLDFGLSLGRTTRGQPVLDIISTQIPISAELGLLSVIVGFIFGIPFGVLAAIYHNTVIDHLSMLLAVALASIPSFVLAPLLILVFINQLHWFPSTDPRIWKTPDLLNWEYVGRVIPPLLVLSTGVSAGLALLTRASLLQVLQDDYIRTARAKGMRERGVLYVHALKNALIPVATSFGPLLAGVVIGSFFVENAFAIPGLGDSFIKSIGERDYNMITGEAILYSTFLVLGNILVDVMYTWLDPRIRFD